MGALPFTVDAQRRTLRGEFRRGQTHGEWSFAVTASSMTGKLFILPERTIGRDVTVRRVPEADVPPPPPPSDYDE